MKFDENVDPEQGYDHAQFERSSFNSVREEGNVFGVVFFFFKRGNMSIISFEHMWSIISLKHTRK